MRLLGLCGSLRATSTNRMLLERFGNVLPAGASLAVADMIGTLPIFNPDIEEPPPPSVRRLIQVFGEADGIVVASPEYAHGIPGGLKNALDWLVSGPWAVGKPVMLMHASHRSTISRDALREVLRTMSFAVFAELEPQLPLLGRSPREAAVILDQENSRQMMITAAEAFAEFIASRTKA